MVRRAGAGEAFDDLSKNVGFQLAGAEIIEEKQRLRTQHRDVIHAMVHQVRANGVMPVEGEGELELRAHAVHGRHQDGLAVFLDVEGEQAAEAADLAEHLAAVGGREQLRQGGLHPVAQINIHAGGGVRFLFDAPPLNRQTGRRARKFHPS